MTTVLRMLQHPVVEVLGWSLVHFLWQALLVAAVLAPVLVSLPRISSHVRYLLLCGALSVMTLCPIATWFWLISSIESGAHHHVVLPSAVLQTETRPGPTSTANDLDARPLLVEPEPGTLETVTATFPAVLPPTVEPASWAERLRRSVEPTLPWFVGGWLIGVFILSVRLLAGWRSVQRLQRRATKSASDIWHERLQRLATRLRISRPVKLVESALVEVPTVIGWLRPMILLPASALSGLEPSQLEALLAHELAHIRRHDYLVNLIQTAIETLLFYHPAVWWLSRRIREEREHCCDDLAVEVCGNRATYARALAEMEELRSSPQLTMAADGGSLLVRIRRLVIGTSDRSEWATRNTAQSGFMVLGLAAICAIAVCVATVQWRAIAAEALTPPPDVDESNDVAAKEDAPPQFLAKLSDGIVVELLGVALQGASASEGWRADGSRFETPSDWPPGRKWNSSQDLGPVVRDFVIKFAGLTRNQGFAWRSPGQWFAPNRDRTDPAIVRVSAAPKEDQPLSFRIGITADEWGPYQSVDTGGKIADPVVVPPHCREVYAAIGPDHIQSFDRRTHFCWSGLRSQAERAESDVVAVDTDGKRHQYFGRTLWGNDPYDSAEVFDLPLSRIDHFEYRLRPYLHWVTFENVALQPGLRTEVKVSAKSTRHAAKLPGGIEIELVGVGFHPSQTREWWKADGSPLDRRPYEKSGATVHPGSPEQANCREFAFEMRGLPQEHSIKTDYGVSSATGSSFSNGLWTGEHAAGPFKTKTISIRIGLTTDPFGPTQTIDTKGRKQKPVEMPAELKPFDERIAPLQVKESDGKAELLLDGPQIQALNKLANWEIHAIDVDGQKQRSTSQFVPVSGELHFGFPLPLNRIARFEYRLRLYRHWVTFENVSLQPGQMTDVKISTISDAPPDTNTDFEKRCMLSPNQIVKYVPLRSSESRLEFYRRTNRQQAELFPAGPDSFVLTWRDGKLSVRGVTMAGGQGTNLAALLQLAVGLKPDEMEGDAARLAKSGIRGDFIVREGAEIDATLAALAKVLSDEFGISVRLTRREVERPVVVCRGQLQIASLAERPPNHIEIYDEAPLAEHDRQERSGTFALFLDSVRQVVGMPVLDETGADTKAQFLDVRHTTWAFPRNTVSRLKPAPGEVDVPRVLRRLTEQSGLTFEVQNRPRWIVFVEDPNAAANSQRQNVRDVQRPATAAEKAVTELVLVFFQDRARRSVGGLMVDTGAGTLIVTTGPAGVVPDGTPHAIDRAFVKVDGQQVEAAYHPKSNAELFVYRAVGGLAAYKLKERTTLSVGDTLSAITLNDKGELWVAPHAATVTALDSKSELSLRDQKVRHQFDHLIEIDRALAEGTPLFKEGKLAGLTLLGTRFVGQDANKSYVVPAERIAALCTEIQKSASSSPGREVR